MKKFAENNFIRPDFIFVTIKALKTNIYGGMRNSLKKPNDLINQNATKYPLVA